MNYTTVLQAPARDLTRTIAWVRGSAARRITGTLDRLRRRASTLLPLPGTMGQPRPQRRIIQQPRRWGARQPLGWTFRQPAPIPVPVYVEADVTFVPALNGWCVGSPPERQS